MRKTTERVGSAAGVDGRLQPCQLGKTTCPPGGSLEKCYRTACRWKALVNWGYGRELPLGRQPALSSKIRGIALWRVDHRRMPWLGSHRADVTVGRRAAYQMREFHAKCVRISRSFQMSFSFP